MYLTSVVRARSVVLMLAVASSSAVWATHPLVTEDTGTQGVGNAELEHGLAWVRDGTARTFSFQPQISYGVLPTLDLIAQPSWVSIWGDGAARSSGLGDTVVDAKWRFFGDAPLSLAVRSGVLLPTSQRGLGLPAGRASVHALLVGSVDAVPWTLHGNLGYTRNPGGPGRRRDLGHVSAAAMYAADERWTVTVDASLDQNPAANRSRWLGSLLAGAVFTLRPGFDVDVGYQVGLNREVGLRQWLIGVTYRWAL